MARFTVLPTVVQVLVLDLNLAQHINSASGCSLRACAVREATHKKCGKAGAAGAAARRDRYGRSVS